MKTHFLLPHSFKRIGWILLALAVPLIVFGELEFLEDITIFAFYNSGMLFNDSSVEAGFFQLIKDDVQFEIVSILLIVGGLFVAFARLKNEDEFISRIRLESLVWATWVHFIILAVLVLGFYGLSFLNIMLGNMFSILFFFILRFHYTLYKSRKSMSHEE